MFCFHSIRIRETFSKAKIKEGQNHKRQKITKWQNIKKPLNIKWLHLATITLLNQIKISLSPDKLNMICHQRINVLIKNCSVKFIIIEFRIILFVQVSVSYTHEKQYILLPIYTIPLFMILFADSPQCNFF